MEIKKYSLISHEWLKKEKKKAKENEYNYLGVNEKEWRYWLEYIDFLEIIEKQLIDPMPLCDKIWQNGCDSEEIDWETSAYHIRQQKEAIKASKKEYLNSDINLD